MRRLIIIALTIFAGIVMCSDAFAIDKPKSKVQKESLQYNIFYHKSFIWMKAGRGSLLYNEEKMANGSTIMHGSIRARSLSIVETFFTVRDTIDTWFTPEYIPLEFSKITNEGSYKSKESYKYKMDFKGAEKTIQNVDSTMIDGEKWRKSSGTEKIQERQKGLVYDMFSIFYLVRSLNYETMKVGTVKRFPIFEGSKYRVVRMTYKGIGESKLRGGGKVSGYQIDLAFDVNGEDSVPMNVWLSNDKAHTPLMMIIHLKRVGSIQCEIAND